MYRAVNFAIDTPGRYLYCKHILYPSLCISMKCVQIPRAWKCNFPVFLGPTERPTSQPIDGHDWIAVKLERLENPEVKLAVLWFCLSIVMLSWDYRTVWFSTDPFCCPKTWSSIFFLLLFFNLGLVRSPCGVCPVIKDCGESGSITPATCQYLKDWIQF